jgi:hypothetical protein
VLIAASLPLVGLFWIRNLRQLELDGGGLAAWRRDLRTPPIPQPKTQGDPP